MVASCIIPLIVRPPAAERADTDTREGTGRFTRKDEAAVSDRETTRSGA